MHKYLSCTISRLPVEGAGSSVHLSERVPGLHPLALQPVGVVGLAKAPPKNCLGEDKALGFVFRRIRVAPLFWSRITENGSLRAWHCTHNGGAEFATRFDSCSQRFAELIVLLPKTHRSVHAAFLRNLFAPIPHECPPIAQSTSRRSLRSSLGLAESASHPRKCKLELPARSSRSSNVGAFAAGTAKRTGDFVPVLSFDQRNKPTVHSPNRRKPT